MIQHFLIDMTAKLRYNHRTAIRRTLRRTEALMLENLPTSTVFTLLAFDQGTNSLRAVTRFKMLLVLDKN